MQPTVEDALDHPPPRPPPPPPTAPPSLYRNPQVYFPTNAPNSVVANRPQHPLLPVPWSTGLFDCCDDVNNCCVTCFCPCITFGQIAEIVDRGSIPCGVSCALYALVFCVTGCACLYSCFYRSKMRGQLLLEETPCVDCAAHCCCESCALCQEYRELRARGFDLHYGWKSYMEMQSVACTLPPAVQGAMQR